MIFLIFPVEKRIFPSRLQFVNRFEDTTSCQRQTLPSPVLSESKVKPSSLPSIPFIIHDFKFERQIKENDVAFFEKINFLWLWDHSAMMLHKTKRKKIHFRQLIRIELKKWLSRNRSADILKVLGVSHYSLNDAEVCGGYEQNLQRRWPIGRKIGLDYFSNLPDFA